MFFGNDRDSLRRHYLSVWEKAKQQQPLTPLERIIAEIIFEHPEYHELLEKGEKNLDKDWLPEGGEANPFLHMGMHIALTEQIQTDRPIGIRDVYQVFRLREEAHAVQHRMMECLGEALFHAQKTAGVPDEQDYLQCLKRLAGMA